MCAILGFSDFAQKCGKKSDSSLKIGKNFTKDFLVIFFPMGILCKMNSVQNYKEYFCKIFCWSSPINLQGKSFIKLNRKKLQRISL